MSILIKGMKMPLNCAMCERWDICECLKEYEDYESILYAVDDGDLVRADDCPLVEIPTPHGRLGDLDKLYEYMENYEDNGGATVIVNHDLIHRDSILYAIEGAPTVIEGSET